MLPRHPAALGGPGAASAQQPRSARSAHELGAPRGSHQRPRGGGQWRWGVWGFTICWTHLPVNRCVLFLGENQIVWKEKLMFQISFGGSHIFGRQLVFWWWGWDFEWVGIYPDDRTSEGLVTSCSLDHWVSQTSQSVDGCVVLFLAIVLMVVFCFFSHSRGHPRGPACFSRVETTDHANH